MIVFGKERDYIIHDENKVCGFFGPTYRFLSNYEICEIFYEGITYSSSEGAYQAAKTFDEDIKLRIVKMSPSEAKKFAYKLDVRKDWKDVRVDVMYNILKDKFTRNEYLKVRLLATGEKYLEETNHWKDIFWGVCEGEGENTLGKLLMKIREELK